jgi:2-polyprenyl-6-hydroxyphenyl methylase/3-demethylubiquinone-9 3-methyltransferase
MSRAPGSEATDGVPAAHSPSELSDERPPAGSWIQDIRGRRRFEFGKNWLDFAALIDDERVEQAESALREWLRPEALIGARFLDAGCGSGLSSLAAARLGATVVSFDFDPDAVEAARLLRRRFEVAHSRWHIETGSVLDHDYLTGLGLFDVVYSWGVLHHTGDMWSALAMVSQAVRPGGRLFISIYNDQRGASRRWRAVKRTYVRVPVARPALLAAVWAYSSLRGAAVRLVQGRNPLALGWSVRTRRPRGMSPWHDLVDWVGGYPFEVARPEEVFEFLKERGYVLERFTTAGGGHGTNQFVFDRLPDSDVAPERHDSSTKAR